MDPKAGGYTSAFRIV